MHLKFSPSIVIVYMEVCAPPDFTSDSWGLVYDLSINILLYKLS